MEELDDFDERLDELDAEDAPPEEVEPERPGDLKGDDDGARGPPRLAAGRVVVEAERIMSSLPVVEEEDEEAEEDFFVERRR